MSCNVYADTGYTNADEMQDKARIVRAITKSIERRELSLADASKLVGLPAGRLRKILRGEFRHEEPEVLLGCLRKLGFRLQVTIRPPDVNALGKWHLLGGPPLL